MRRTRLLGSGLAAAIAVAAIAVAVTVSGASAKTGAASDKTPSACHLSNGIQHVVEVVFDNVHYNRDNPNVLSDIEPIPSLENFITSNGTLTTNFTGLYGDRQRMGGANDYYAFTPSGGVTPEQSVFSYWTGAGADSFPQ